MPLESGTTLGPCAVTKIGEGGTGEPSQGSGLGLFFTLRQPLINLNGHRFLRTITTSEDTSQLSQPTAAGR